MVYRGKSILLFGANELMGELLDHGGCADTLSDNTHHRIWRELIDAIKTPIQRETYVEFAAAVAINLLARGV